MAYEIIVTSARHDSYLYSEHFGSAASVSQYWSSIAVKLNLPILYALGDDAASDEGFKISGEALKKLSRELIFLEKYWNNNESELGINLVLELKDKLARLRRGIEIAIEHNTELSIF